MYVMHAPQGLAELLYPWFTVVSLLFVLIWLAVRSLSTSIQTRVSPLLQKRSTVLGSGARFRCSVPSFRLRRTLLSRLYRSGRAHDCGCFVLSACTPLSICNADPLRAVLLCTLRQWLCGRRIVRSGAGSCLYLP